MTQDRPLSDAQRLDWLRLIRSENVGPITFFRLLERFGSAGEALAAIPNLAKAGGRKKPIKVCTKAAAEREIITAQALGARLLCTPDSAFPQMLAQTDGAPPCLYLIGHPGLLNKPTIAVVGARNASASAKQFTRKLAMDLGAHGFVVASGLARGIDTAAHEGSLERGTIAVMAGGVDVVYPPENDRLHAAIAGQGALLSEMPPGTEPQARHFPRRNRIVSGLAQGTVIVEAAARSGSLITARYAAEQGRDVYAVPGSPMDGRCEGPNQLLRDGAILCRGVQDILDQQPDLFSRPLEEGRRGASPLPPPPAQPSPQELDRARQSVLSNLSMTAVTVDEIIRQCQLSPSVVSIVLLELDLAGRLERHPGNRVSLMPEA
jgi:DNA processing protein